MSPYTTNCYLVMLALFSASTGNLIHSATAAETISFYGYDNCLQLKNQQTRVILCPAAGGRVLEYSLHGKNALYLAPDGAGAIYKPGQRGISMTAGRFDIGPEQTIPKHPQLWMGRWEAEITGPLSARLTSVADAATGVQLVRDFRLDPRSTKLTCQQTIKNISKTPRAYCHWSRTFAHGHGICVIPLSKPSRFPHGYVMYGPGPAINFRPEDPNIRIRDGFLEIIAAPQYPKLGMDSYAGWFAYLMKNDIMFVKQFPTYKNRVYNEVAGLTMSIWYPDRPMCELEPIGPRENLLANESASFTETWRLLPFPFPAAGKPVDLAKVSELVQENSN